jgi:M6 family metalloprotease-like protein
VRIAGLRLLPVPILVLGAALVLLPRPVHAVPAFPGKQGTQGPREGFSTVRLRPDFATLPERGERIAIQAQGTYRTLAVRVAFSDTPIDSSDAYYDRLLLFLNQFWNQNTDGQITIQSDLWPTVYTLPHPMAYYGDDARYQERLVYLVRDLVAQADSAVDFRPYQSLVIFHGGQGQEADVLDDSRDQVWSAFVTPDDFRTILPDSTGLAGIPTNDLVGGQPLRIKEAVVLPESESQDGYEFGMLGVTAHEYGHQLGLPDLYDTTGEEGGYNQGVGSWDIMGQGVWDFNGYVPAGPSAWSRMFLGVLAPQRVTGDATVTLAHLTRPIGFNPRAALIPVTQSEYFLIENRDQDSNWNGKFDFDDANGNGQFDFYIDSYAGAEFDFFLPGNGTGSGVIIYHVDEAKIAATLRSNTVEGDTERKGVDVVEADGIEDLDEPPNAFNGGSPEDVFRRFHRDRFTPETTPATEAYGRVRTGISVTGIGPPDTTLDADSLMLFHAAFDRLRPGWPVVLNSRVRGTPPLAADLDGNGVLELIVPAQRLNNAGEVYVLEPDGSDYLTPDPNPAAPTPFATPTVTGSGGTPVATAVVSTPCVGDIDGDGGNELVFAAQNGAIFAYHANGTEVRDGDGNPSTLGVLVPGCTPGTAACGGRGQPILVDLDGDGAKEIVYGFSAGILGTSSLTAVKVTPTGIQKRSIFLGGSTEAAPTAADLDGDNLPEVIVSNSAREVELLDEFYPSGLSIANWEIFSDPPPNSLTSCRIASFNGPPSAPVIADLNRDGKPDVVVADSTGLIHAFTVTLSPHIPGDAPDVYTEAKELIGWPVEEPAARGPVPEVSIGDLEGDGYPEVFHMGAGARVTAVHYSGSERSGFPLATAQTLAAQDSTGLWPPLLADVDGDGRRDVIPIIPDGRRPAYRPDGTPIASFVELGSTAAGPPPILADLDGDGQAEWVEVFDQQNQALLTVRAPAMPLPAGAVAWGQYRFGPTRDGFFPAGPTPSGGTPILSQVYGYPNPSRGTTTTIHYRLGADASVVRVRILDPAGATVAELPTGPADRAGSSEHGVVWSHAGLASGVYLCRVEAETGGGTEVRFAKLAILR